MNVQTQVELKRIHQEKIEIIRRLRDLEKIDRTTSERMGDLDSDNLNENVFHLPTLEKGRRNFLIAHNHQPIWTNRTVEEGATQQG